MPQPDALLCKGEAEYDQAVRRVQQGHAQQQDAPRLTQCWRRQ